MFKLIVIVVLILLVSKVFPDVGYAIGYYIVEFCQFVINIIKA